jgi:hypothetical protein
MFTSLEFMMMIYLPHAGEVFTLESLNKLELDVYLRA